MALSDFERWDDQICHGNTCGEGRNSTYQPRPLFQGGGTYSPQNFGTSYVRSWTSTTKFGTVQRFHGVSHAPLHEGCAPALPKFCFFCPPTNTHWRRTINFVSWQSTEEWRILEVSHAIAYWINASRGLSATAQFLVCTGRMTSLPPNQH